MLPHIEALPHQHEAVEKAVETVEALPDNWLAEGIDTTKLATNLVACVASLAPHHSGASSAKWDRAARIKFAL